MSHNVRISSFNVKMVFPDGREGDLSIDPSGIESADITIESSYLGSVITFELRSFPITGFTNSELVVSSPWDADESDLNALFEGLNLMKG